MSLIFLVGMPGVGKTFWGHKWAKNSGFDFADLDDQIEASAGTTIPYIFQSIGEEGFRELEASVLLDTIAVYRDKDTIIATGGGTPAFNSNMTMMMRSGCVVYLRSTIDRLLSQLTSSEVFRPLFHHMKPDRAMLEAMLAQRKSFYEQAHMILEADELHTDTFAQIQTECTSRQL